MISTSLKAEPNSLEDPPEADSPGSELAEEDSPEAEPAEEASPEVEPAEEASPEEDSPDEDPVADDSPADDSSEEDSLAEDSLAEDSLEDDSLGADLVEGDPLEEAEQPATAAAAKSAAPSRNLGISSSRRSTVPVLRFLATLSPCDFKGPAKPRQ